MGYLFETSIFLPKYEDKECYYSDGFQDYTDYCKFFYKPGSVLEFENNKNFQKVTEEDVANIVGYIENFEGWMENQDFKDRYDFKMAQIKAGDYFAIVTKEGQPIGQGYYDKYEDYDVYYFDTNKNILYMFHNNI